MKDFLCTETLLATIGLWIALFGLCDILVQHIERIEHKIAFYCALLLLDALFVWLSQSVNSCALL